MGRLFVASCRSRRWKKRSLIIVQNGQQCLFGRRPQTKLIWNRPERLPLFDRTDFHLFGNRNFAKVFFVGNPDDEFMRTGRLPVGQLDRQPMANINPGLSRPKLVEIDDDHLGFARNALRCSPVPCFLADGLAGF